MPRLIGEDESLPLGLVQIFTFGATVENFGNSYNMESSDVFKYWSRPLAFVDQNWFCRGIAVGFLLFQKL